MAGPDKRRRAFLGLAPDGYHIRMMEPGEAEALRALGIASGLFETAAPAIADVVRWLLRHEVFVAEDGTGRVVGFAAARDAVDLYWLAGLAVDPAARGRGIRKALLAAVVARAGWFFHRAVGLASQGGEDADWYRRRRFLAVARADWTPPLERLVGEMTGLSDAGEDRSSVSDLVGTERTVMVHWI